MQTIEISNPGVIADAIGQKRAELKELRAELSFYEDMAKNTGQTVLEGDLFKVTVVESDRETINWRAVAAKLTPSYQLINAHTKHSLVTSIRVAAHSK